MNQVRINQVPVNQVGIGLLLSLGVSAWVGVPVMAGSDTSPSARAAAQLKHRPPAGWINHYLPEDRYKIKGGIWKYVSTEADDFYHRPDSPVMLGQPAGSVIGFASTADAEEAGYRPGPSVSWRERPSANSNSVTMRVTPSDRAGAGGGVSGGGAPGGVNATTPIIVSIPMSQIPKPIRVFIALVDEYADRIQRTSSARELSRISLELSLLTQDMRDGMVASMWGNQRVSRDVTAMMGILIQLRKAVDYKRRPDYVGIGTAVYGQLLQSAQEDARGLIPQVAQIRSRLWRNQVDEYERQQMLTAQGRR